MEGYNLVLENLEDIKDISSSELALVEQISVLALPDKVVNQAERLKRQFVNPTTSSNGISKYINLRFQAIYKTISMIKETWNDSIPSNMEKLAQLEGYINTLKEGVSEEYDTLLKIENAIKKETQDRETAIDSAINKLKDNVNVNLDTLKKIAQAINNDSNFATTVASNIAQAQKTATSYTDSQVTEAKRVLREEIKSITGGTDGDVTTIQGAIAKANEYTNSQIALEVQNRNAAITQKINEIVGGAGDALDTLNELAKALGDDPNFATTVANNIGAAKREAIEHSDSNLETAKEYSDSNLETAKEYTDSEIEKMNEKGFFYTETVETDLNLIVNNGFYLLKESEIYTNSPNEMVVPGILKVYNSGNENEKIEQDIYDKEGNVYKRFRYNTGTWYEWQQYWTTIQTQEQLDLKVNISDLEENYYNKEEIFDKIYPIGSIYMSVLEISPAELFGGSWEKLENRFLLGAGSDYNLGDTGGEATHTLTEEEMPRHKHETRDQDTDGIFGRGFGASRAGIKYTAYESNDNVGALLETEYKGNSRPHNNMPPYLVVNMWKRIA